MSLQGRSNYSARSAPKPYLPPHPDRHAYPRSSAFPPPSDLRASHPGPPPPFGHQATYHRSPEVTKSHVHRPEDNLPAPRDRSASNLSPQADGPSKPPPKRSRNGSMMAQSPTKTSEARETTSPTPVTGKGKERSDDSPNGAGALPAVLVREKKQKACANCRRAKLKCIVEDGQTDCVRCKARKEKCVFYPRTHDEDWQQTLTSDVYSAVAHLANLSQAVHHILHHLSDRNIIPPYRSPAGEPLEQFEMPDRDMNILQGWGAERNKETDVKPGKRRRVAEKEEEDDVPPDVDCPTEADVRERLLPVQSSTSNINAYHQHRHMSLSMEHLPPMGWTAHSGASSHAASAPTTLRRPSTVLAPIQQAAHVGQIQLTPTSELNLGYHVYFPVAHNHPSGVNGYHAAAPPTATLSPVISPPAIHQITPTSLQEVTPIISRSSLPIESRARPAPTWIGGSQPLQTPPSATEIKDDSWSGVILGSEDNRNNVITKNIVRPEDALQLVKYFHVRLSTFLFGYRLRLGHFPYLPDGPQSMTPFIMAVICLLASERIPRFHDMYHAGLADEVKELFLRNPAESWRSLEDSKDVVSSPLRDAEQAVTKAVEPKLCAMSVDSEWLDPELGIGPEEIIGATTASLYMAERVEAATVAESAFRWARGWIKIVDGTLTITENPDAPDSGYDPSPHRSTLSPPDIDPITVAHEDLALCMHAQIVHTMLDWRHANHDILATATGRNDVAYRCYHLMRETNANLDWSREEFRALGLPDEVARLTTLFWLFGKAWVNHRSSELLGMTTPFRPTAMADAMQAAMGFFEVCAAWQPKADLTNLPQPFLKMVSILARVVRDSFEHLPIKELDPRRACELFGIVGNSLHEGGLPGGHNARNAADSCLKFAAEIREKAGLRG